MVGPANSVSVASDISLRHVSGRSARVFATLRREIISATTPHSQGQHLGTLLAKLADHTHRDLAAFIGRDRAGAKAVYAVTFVGKFVQPDDRLDRFLLGEEKLFVGASIRVAKPKIEQV